MSARPLVRRAVAVSATAAGLSVLSCGIAVAAPSPLPPLPDPGDTIATVQQTVGGAVDTVSSVVPVPVPPSVAGGTPQTPTTQPPTTQPPATQTPVTRTPSASRVPTVVHHRSAANSAHPAAGAPTDRATTSAAMPPYDFAAFRYPTATAMAAGSSQAPAIAPVPAAPAAPITTRLAADSDHQQPSTLRGLLLVLAAVAAAGLSIEHMRQAQRRLAL